MLAAAFSRAGMSLRAPLAAQRLFPAVLNLRHFSAGAKSDDQDAVDPELAASSQADIAEGTPGTVPPAAVTRGKRVRTVGEGAKDSDAPPRKFRNRLNPGAEGRDGKAAASQARAAAEEARKARFAAVAESVSQVPELPGSAESRLRAYEARQAVKFVSKAEDAYSSTVAGPAGLSGLDMDEEDDEDGDADTADAAAGLVPQGIPVDYCIFCYHGSHHIAHENTALLSKFVSEKGFILGRKYTKCCAKHQRSLSKTIKRARNLNIVPFHSKLHPKLRFSSFKPTPVGATAADALAAKVGEADAAVTAAQRSAVKAALGELSSSA